MQITQEDMIEQFKTVVEETEKMSVAFCCNDKYAIELTKMIGPKSGDQTVTMYEVKMGEKKAENTFVLEGYEARLCEYYNTQESALNRVAALVFGVNINC